MQRFALTASEVSRFHREGFLVLDRLPLLSNTSVIEELKKSFSQCFAGRFSYRGSYPDEWHWREGISKPGKTREICNAWKSDRYIRNLLLSSGCESAVGSMVHQLYPSWPSVRLGQDDIIWKVPTDSADTTSSIGYHIDSEYISANFRPYQDNMVTVWIPLDDADEDNGGIEYLRGSHSYLSSLLERGPRTRAPIDEEDSSEADGGVADAGFHGADLFSQEAPFLEALWRYHHDFLQGKPMPEAGRAARPENGAEVASPEDIVSVNGMERVRTRVKAGHCILHHQHVLHGSAPNRSASRHRRALALHVVRGDVKFIEEPGYIYGRYKLDDSSDMRDEFFPVLWRPPAKDSSSL